MGRVRNVWVTLNPPRRRGTLWIEIFFFFALVVPWTIFENFVYGSGPGNLWLNTAWHLIPYIVWAVWVVWYRKRHPDETIAAHEPPPTVEPCPPGMMYATGWQEAWLRQQRERRRTRPYCTFWGAMWMVAIAVIVIGIYASQWHIVAVGVVIAALLGVDWWRYFPHDRRQA